LAIKSALDHDRDPAGIAGSWPILRPQPVNGGLQHRHPTFTPTFDHQIGYFYHHQGYFLIN
jgi:hypothetical protein